MTPAKSYYYLSHDHFKQLHSIDNLQLLDSYIESQLELANETLRPLGLKAYSETSKSHLLNFPMETKKRALTKLMDYVSFVEAMNRSLVTLKDDKACLKVIQKNYGLKISKEFLSSIEDGDAVEIIDKDGVQVYRNLGLLMLTDYDVLFLCSFEWTDLYARDSQITQKLLSYVPDLLQKNTPLKKIDTVEHVMVEKISNRRLLFSQNHRYCATILNRNDEIVGIILSIRAQTIGEQGNSSVGLLRSH